MLKKPWEIENIEFDTERKTDFFSKFTIYDDSKLIQSHIFKITITDDFVSSIKDSKIETGIMISKFQINNILIYLFILDDAIFIINQINLPKFQEYFNEHIDSLMFMTAEIKENFFEALFSKLQISEQNDQNSNERKEVDKAIIKEIIGSTIKKSQYRTLQMNNEILPNKYKSTNDNYKLDDFFLIQSQDFKLYFNSKDQIFNVLKFYENEKRFNHEIDFYHQIENTFPFIRKIFGIIKQPNELPIIILEFVEGESLDKFLLSEKEIEFNTKIKIIVEILFSVYYIHSNGFYLRDLKPDNIIIDSKNDAILIDFDCSKKMYSSNEEELKNTGDIGSLLFTAPEQFNSINYTYKVDSYSVGMIIHFIISRHEYKISNGDLYEIHERKENISTNNKFPKLPHEYEFIYKIYKECFEISPNSRPCITLLIDNIIFNNEDNQLMSSNKKELPYIIKQIEKYESILIISEKYMHEKPIERSYLEYFLGYIYYYGKYVSKSIDKSVIQLEKSSNQNNSYAQFLLGKIYYKGEHISRDINKSIHYLTLSSNQNDSYAQCFLGEIYYDGEYISRDINKSIHYLTLSANQNNSDAQYYLGEIYYTDEYISRDINKSIHYLTLSANQNNSDAQYYLGCIYYLGQYISRDINKSIHYLTLSANQNNSDAQYYLGEIYYLGQYISRDINKSLHYLTFSSSQNNSDAQYLLGEIYYDGKYISRDINKSLHYLTLSSNQNNSNAQYLLGEIYYDGKYISRDINKSINYLTLSANQNHSYAQYLLGYIYYLGQYISRDINKSIHYLTFSSNQNNLYAQYLLGYIYYLGEYISRDINKSIHYLTLSSNQNNSDAQFLLGKIYYDGEYISQDINKSIHYLTLSSNQNHSDAQCLLGKIYYDGNYIDKNIKKSIHYFKESSCFYNSIAKNYLGIIYKNGDGVEKNIYFAKIYFKEAIKQKDESYSMYNLARIYYFGIEHKRKISKAITLLKKASYKQLHIADLFLFYIFSYCDDTNFLNQLKSQQYQKKCQNQILLNMNFIINNTQNLHIFLRDFDLTHGYDYSIVLLYFFVKGTFFNRKVYDDQINRSLRKILMLIFTKD